jgi:hypothetical protein
MTGQVPAILLDKARLAFSWPPSVSLRHRSNDNYWIIQHGAARPEISLLKSTPLHGKGDPHCDIPPAFHWIPLLKLLARPVAATKVEDSAGHARSAFRAVSSIKQTTKHRCVFKFIGKTSPRNAEKLQIKNLGFFADCAAKKWPFGQPVPRAVCEKARSAFSRQRSARHPQLALKLTARNLPGSSNGPEMTAGSPSMSA